MKRRAFLGRGAAGLIAGTALAKPALAQGRMEWRLVTAWPKQAQDLMGGVERLALRIQQMSDSRLSVKVLAAGELVPEGQVFDAVSQGMAELGHCAAHDHLSKTAGSAFFAAVPFGMTGAETASWINHGDAQGLWDELYAPLNVKPFLAGDIGPRPLGWFRRELKTAADLKDLKVRIPGWGGRVLSVLGAELVNTAPNEIAAQLESGGLDGASWSSLHGDTALGLLGAGRYCYLPGVLAPGTTLELLVNKQRFDALAPDLKAIVKAAAEATHADIESEQAIRSAEAFDALRSQRGPRVLKATNELLAALGAATNAYLRQERDKADTKAKRLFGSYFEARGRLVPFQRSFADAYGAVRDLKVKFPS